MAVTDVPDAVQRDRGQLRAADEHLRALISTYREKPRAIDDAVLGGVDGCVSVEAVVVKTYSLTECLVYAPGSPIGADPELGEAFRQQKEELIDFYWSALSALEVYREILMAYHVVKRRSASAQPGDLEQIRRDKQVHLEERKACLAALTDLSGKFSAMLAVLNPVRLP